MDRRSAVQRKDAKVAERAKDSPGAANFYWRALRSLRSLRLCVERTVAGSILAAAAAACAHVEPPPGGPEDRIPPGVLSTTPEDEAVVASYDGPVIFEFNERISERGVADAVIVSPRTSPVEVSAGRSAIRVSLRNGWESDVIYQVTIGTDVRDLFNNPIAEPIRLIFSTGPEIPETRLSGSVVDRITGRPASDIRVEAIRGRDSLVYAVPTGQDGAYELGRIPEGEYQVRAFEDVNRNRSLDPYEAWDSAAATILSAEPVEIALAILTPDSTAATIQSVTATGTRIEIELDDYLDPAQELEPSQVTIVHPSTGPVSIARVAIGDLPAVDSISPDTAAALAPADTLQPAAQPLPPAPAPVDPDLPSRLIVVELPEGTELEPSTEYAVTVQGVRNLNEITGDAEGTLEIDPPLPDP